MNENYQKKLEQIIASFGDNKNKPKLLLHSCCAPCSSYCLEYLSKYFEITVYYYNPNITSDDEYNMRISEQIRLINELNAEYGSNIHFAKGIHDTDNFLCRVKGMENLPEGGERCRVCFSMRLENSAIYAAENGFDYFTTTLTISPMKNAHILNEIGNDMGEKHNIEFLPSDFKKKNGYKRSIELSAKYNLYRQNFCGCAFSKAEAVKRENTKG